MTWHIRLTQARVAASLSKTKLAQLVVVSAQAVTQWESGQITSLSADNLLSLCDALQVPPAWLLRGTGPIPAHIALLPNSENIRPESLGERIKSARQAAGLSQEALGTLLGKTQGAISQWELNTSTPEFDAAVPLARALGVSLDWLLGADDTPLVTLRTALMKRSAMEVVSQLSEALANGRIPEQRLRLLSALITEFVA